MALTLIAACSEARRPPQDAAGPPGALYQQDSNARGEVLSVRIARGGGPDVYLDAEALTADDAIEFSPQINDAGHIAWATTVHANAESRVVLDGEVIFEAEDTLNRRLRLDEEALYWLRFQARSLQNELCRYELASGALDCVPLELFPQDIALVDEGLLLSGFDPEAGSYEIERFDAKLGQRRVLHSSVNSTHMERRTTGPVFLQVQGDAEPRGVFFALRELFRSQAGEPFSVGDDAMGRLAWNVNYRLSSMSALYRKTEDPRLLSRIERTVEELLEGADADGLYHTRKYSIDRESDLVLLVDNACIHQALLDAAPLLDPALAARIVEQARRMYRHFEGDWRESYYRATPCQPYQYDGIPLPLNRQNMMGLVALALYRQTGEAAYRERVEALFEQMLAHLEAVEGVALWHYSHRLFYEGWTEGTYESCHMPARAASSDDRYEDYSHARISVEFLMEAAELLERPLPIDVDAIGANLLRGRASFARFISGHTEDYPPSYAYLPPLPWAAAIRPFFASAVMTPAVDFDRQAIGLSHARAAALEESVSWSMRVEELQWREGELVAGASQTFTSSAERPWGAVVDYWLEFGAP